MDKQVVISFKTVLFAILSILAMYVIYKLKAVIALLLVSTLLVISLEPLIAILMRITFFNKPLSRNVSVMLSYLLLVVILVVFLTIGWSPLFTQAQRLINSLSSIVQFYGFDKINNFRIDSLLPQAASVSGGLYNLVASILSNVAWVFSFFIISVYMSLDWINIKSRFVSGLPVKYRSVVQSTIKEIETNISHWLKGQFILMFVVGLTTYIGLVILGVDFPLALGLIAGMLEIVPMMGPILSAIVAAIVAFAQDPIKGIGVLILFTLIQQLENNILVPKIMQKVSGFSPLVVLLALLVGSNFFGVMGAILAVPITMIATIILKKIFND